MMTLFGWAVSQHEDILRKASLYLHTKYSSIVNGIALCFVSFVIFFSFLLFFVLKNFWEKITANPTELCIQSAFAFIHIQSCLTTLFFYSPFLTIEERTLILTDWIEVGWTLCYCTKLFINIGLFFIPSLINE